MTKMNEHSLSVLLLLILSFISLCYNSIILHKHPPHHFMRNFRCEATSADMSMSVLCMYIYVCMYVCIRMSDMIHGAIVCPGETFGQERPIGRTTRD